MFFASQRRLLSLVLSAAAATLVTAGCGSNDTSPQAGIAKLSQRFAASVRADDYDAQCALYTATARADLVAAAAKYQRRPVRSCVAAVKVFAAATSHGPVDLSRPVVYRNVKSQGASATADDPDGQPTPFKRVHGKWLFAAKGE